MPDRDAALDKAIHETAGILAAALLRILFPESARKQVDLTETESLHVIAG